MSEIKHTPGPWHITDASMRWVHGAGQPVCQVSSRLDLPGFHQDVALNREANARLIAAAPDLLEAAKIAEKAIDILWVSHHANRSDDALEKLRAAIAKALAA